MRKDRFLPWTSSGSLLTLPLLPPQVVLFGFDTRSQDVHSQLILMNNLSCDEREDLVDWCLVPSSREAWLLHQSEQGHWLTCRSTKEPGRLPVPALFSSDVIWQDEEEEAAEGEFEEAEGREEGWLPLQQDPQEACLKAVFTPGRFSAIAISRAVTALRQSAESVPPLGKMSVGGINPGTLDAVREEIIVLVEEKVSKTSYCS